jgi:alkylated DNA repair dioxygenase AlkB
MSQPRRTWQTWGMARAAGSLFGPNLPPGFQYQDDFISKAEQAELVDQVNQIEFSAFEMRGVVAKRRVAFFGASYDRGEQPSPPIPEFLSPVRIRLADLAGVQASDFAMVLINEYRPGTPIGWHRDAPQYELIAGVSLVSSCRMRLRPYVSPSEAGERGLRRTTTHEIQLLPRSAYVMQGEARSGYEHSIPAVTELRYSITFRTLRGR